MIQKLGCLQETLTVKRCPIKYRKKDGSTEYCFSLNNTALASPRILIAILENYQQKDGSVKAPEVLQSLVGFNKIINPTNTTNPTNKPINNSINK